MLCHQDILVKVQLSDFSKRIQKNYFNNYRKCIANVAKSLGIYSTFNTNFSHHLYMRKFSSNIIIFIENDQFQRRQIYNIRVIPFFVHMKFVSGTSAHYKHFVRQLCCKVTTKIFLKNHLNNCFTPTLTPSKSFFPYIKESIKNTVKDEEEDDPFL